MPIQQVQQENKEEPQNKPLLNIQLPAPLSGNPNEQLTVGRHNSAAKYNFEQVADIILKIVNNQKLMGLAITELDKKIKEIQENQKTIGDNISKLLQNEQPTTPTVTNK